MVPFARLLTALKDVPDPRRAQGKRYPLQYLLMFTVLALLSGARSYRGIITFMEQSREHLSGGDAGGGTRAAGRGRAVRPDGAPAGAERAGHAGARPAETWRDDPWSRDPRRGGWRCGRGSLSLRR